MARIVARLLLAGTSVLVADIACGQSYPNVAAFEDQLRERHLPRNDAMRQARGHQLPESDQSIFTPALLTTRAYFASSLLMNAANCAGVPDCVSAPCAAKL